MDNQMTYFPKSGYTMTQQNESVTLVANGVDWNVI